MIEFPIRVRIKRQIFAGDGGFMIVLVEPVNEIFQISAKGVMHVEVGEEYILNGELKDDDRFGEYIHVYSYEKPKVTDGEQIIKYLSSTKFSGVGRRSAKKIVDALGNNALDLIKGNPTVLDDVEISETTKQEIIAKHGKDEILSDLYQILIPLNVSEYVISNLYQHILTNKIANPLTKIKQNPYIFIKDVYGFTYEKADEIFLSFGGFTDSNCAESPTMIIIVPGLIARNNASHKNISTIENSSIIINS